VLLSGAWSAPARAQTCTISAPSFAFGNVDVTANATVDLFGTLSINCTGSGGLKNTTVNVCPSIGPGSGGSGSLAANGVPSNNGPVPRYMLRGAGGRLAYNVFSDANRAQVWGSTAHGWANTAPPLIPVRLNSSSNGTATATVYARISAGQGGAAVGAYSSGFAGQMSVRYALSTNAGAGSCATMTGGTVTTAPTFTVSATVVPQCTVSAGALDFGDVLEGLTVARDSTSTISVACTTGATYKIGLGPGNGQGGANDPTQRKLRMNGLSDIYVVTYGLYRDATRAQPWGDTLPAAGVAGNTQDGMGQGSSTVNHTVFGRVPPQSPLSGVYSDTIVVTLTY